MSPEHASGRRVTPASDVFTLGLVAAEAATGRHPYGEGGGLVVATRIAGTDREPPDLSAHPPALRRLLAATLAARPEDRPTAAEVAALCGAGAGFAAAGRLPKRVASAVTAIDRASAKIFPDARDPRTGWLDRLRGDT